MRFFTNAFVFFLCLSLFPQSAKADANYLPGMVELNIGAHKFNGKNPGTRSDTVVFRFFRTPTDVAPARAVSCYCFLGNPFPSREFFLERDFRSWLQPMIFKDDSTHGHYAVFLTCVSQKGDWCEVIVNEQTQEKMWIKRGNYIRFRNWKDFAQKKYLLVHVNTSVYAARDTNSTPLDVKVNCFEINEVNGDWMLISTSKNKACNSSGQPKLKKVWVRFKTPERLHVTFDAGSSD